MSIKCFDSFFFISEQGNERNVSVYAIDTEISISIEFKLKFIQIYSV